MFEETLYPPQFLTISNYLKGGDFMSIEAIFPQPKSVTGLNNTRFPESRGGGTEATKQLSTVASAAEIAALSIPTALEIAQVFGLDLVTLNSVSEMDSASGQLDGRKDAFDVAAVVVGIDRVVLASVDSMDGRE